MYTPEHFRIDDQNQMLDLMRANPFAVLVSAGEAGLVATHMPTVVKPGHDGVPGVVECHFARPNSHWTELSPYDEAMFIFQASEAYIRPGWYPSKVEHGKAVPTWNYEAIHAYGRPTVIQERDWLMQHVAELSRQQEQAYEQPWSASDAPESYMNVMLRGIVGMRFEITRLEGKRKLSQNRPAADQAGVVRGLEARATGDDWEMAQVVRWLSSDRA